MPPTSPWLSRILTLNLLVQMGIIVTGGVVRLTGSGLGCPTWPECTPGSFTPTREQAQGIHTYIEYGNRTLTGALVIVALAALFALRRWAPHRPRLQPWIWQVGIGIILQAGVGGITVLTGLHPTVVGLHYLLSAWLVWASATLWWRERYGEAEVLDAARQPVRWLGLAVLAVGLVVLTLGTVVTGSGPHAGDPDEPVRYALDPRTIAWLHADAVMLFVGLVVAALLASYLVWSRRAVRMWLVVLGVSMLQGVVGYAQYLSGLPELLVGAHILLSAVLVAAVTMARESLTTRAAGQPSPGSAA